MCCDKSYLQHSLPAQRHQHLIRKDVQYHSPYSNPAAGKPNWWQRSIQLLTSMLASSTRLCGNMRGAGWSGSLGRGSISDACAARCGRLVHHTALELPSCRQTRGLGSRNGKDLDCRSARINGEPAARACPKQFSLPMVGTGLETHRKRCWKILVSCASLHD